VKGRQLCSCLCEAAGDTAAAAIAVLPNTTEGQALPQINAMSHYMACLRCLWAMTAPSSSPSSRRLYVCYVFRMASPSSVQVDRVPVKRLWHSGIASGWFTCAQRAFCNRMLTWSEGWCDLAAVAKKHTAAGLQDYIIVSLLCGGGSWRVLEQLMSRCITKMLLLNIKSTKTECSVVLQILIMLAPVALQVAC